MKILIILLVLGIVLVLGGLVFINSGLFDVAATKPETGIAKWVLETTKEKSVVRVLRILSFPTSIMNLLLI